MKSLEAIRIPRHAILEEKPKLELLGFCDASEKAYAAVLYLKSYSSSNHKISLLLAKTRVAPKKKETLPRLELSGAVLLAKLATTAKKFLRREISHVHLWTDSTIVLAWLSNPNRWKTFVSNRITEIVQSYPRPHWHHVKSEDNPADPASRGIFPEDLRNLPIWWNGPSWCTSKEFNFPEEHKDRYSSLTRLLRVVATCLRLSPKRRVPVPSQEYSVGELLTALHRCIGLAQESAFPQELQSLRSSQPLSKNSKILPLSPFLDPVGLLRVGGRLRHSNLPEDQKFPILLPSSGHFTQLVIAEEHLRSLHAGPQLLLSNLQLRYWILRGRATVSNFVKKCIVCYRHRTTSLTQKMGDLPPMRVNPSRPFSKTGVDFAGPFNMKRSMGPRSTQLVKCYVCVFICYATHAIHLEVVSDLSTAAFISSLKRFVSRRGLCSDISSDCGTNFVGADRELRRDLEFLRTSNGVADVSKFLSSRGVTWHFNPPSSPHFGGLWESGVRLVKGHMKKVIGLTTLNFEEFTTVLTQIEACINSRPITSMSSDPNDLFALTPGHFLVGGPLTAIPEPDLTDVKLNRLSRWQLCQQMFQHFWNRWHREYLHTLQQRAKWSSTAENIQIGTMVLIKDNRLSPMNWRLGRIIATHPGKDNLVRVVTVKTEEGDLKRPIVQLCPLPLPEATQFEKGQEESITAT
ncbi:unnamed protein product [Allacma fusca]|uniref:Integrase catalytic domain-containing protein n=1 Tax=Allacma fusca TaxID=39272 RepID=A0A8J2J6A9_9HEXA|nr:unnamed protein product [Allacma fusca]